MTVDTQFKGNIGVYLAAAKISSKNLIALTTSRNTKGYDIVVLDPLTNKGRGFQVKCTDMKDFPVMPFFLKDYDKEIQSKIIMDYIFVDISNINNPRYFIVPVDEMRKLLKSSVENWIQNAKHRKPIDEMIRTETKKQSWSITLDEILPYENNWTQLAANL